MCVKDEFPIADTRLTQWSDWLHELGGVAKLNYPTHSPEQSQPGAGWSDPINPKAVEVENLMIKLHGQWKMSHKFIKSYYYFDLNMRDAASYNGVALVTFVKYFERGMGWMEANLK